MNNISYKTKQKEIILNFLKKNKNSHLTVDDILYHLISEGTPVGKTTVYRVLDSLENQKLIRKYIVSGSSSCFQYVDDKLDCQSHYHLKCCICDKLFHISCKDLDKATNSILKFNNFIVDNSKTVLYGTCTNCMCK